MKILISSKYLYGRLKDIDFDNYCLNKCIIRKDQLTLILNKGDIIIEKEILISTDGLSNGFQFTCRQSDARWDWVKSVVSKINDYPIVLDIDDDFLQMQINF